jgi:hypothetical protein
MDALLNFAHGMFTAEQWGGAPSRFLHLDAVLR